MSPNTAAHPNRPLSDSTHVAWPDLTRPDVGAVVIQTWNGLTADTQQAAASRLESTWRTTDWPDALLSLSALVSSDHEAVIAYAQFSSIPDDATRSQLTALMAAADSASPNSSDIVTYRIYRQTRREPSTVPGTAVVISVTAENDAVARTWVDTVFEALASEPEPMPGGLGGHFHISLDGTRIVNYAEWESEQAHIDAVTRGDGSVGTTPAWQRVRQAPGVTFLGFRRYRPYATLEAPAALRSDREVPRG